MMLGMIGIGDERKQEQGVQMITAWSLIMQLQSEGETNANGDASPKTSVLCYIPGLDNRAMSLTCAKLEHCLGQSN
jgi:hypothetical protein